MSESEYNPFKIAQAQLDEAARIIDLDPALHHLLRWPRRELHVSLPVRMDNGTVRRFQGYRVHHNDSRGPARGGLRLRPDDTIDTVRALAAWMTWQAAVVNIPLGGGQGSVVCNPHELSLDELERIVRGYVRALAYYAGTEGDMPAPDMDTSPQIATWMTDECSAIHAGNGSHPAATGHLGSAGRREAVVRGSMSMIRQAADILGLDLARATVAIQGYGALGQFAHKMVTEILGATVVAISDAREAIYCPGGIGPDEAMAWQDEPDRAWQDEPGRARPCETGGFRRVTRQALIELDVDILFLAAIDNQIGPWNANKVRARIIAELTGGPATAAVDEMLQQNGVYLLPDLLCSAGALVVSHLAQAQNAPIGVEALHRLLDQQMAAAFHAVHDSASRYRVHNRLGTCIVAVGRVAEAMSPSPPLGRRPG